MVVVHVLTHFNFRLNRHLLEIAGPEIHGQVGVAALRSGVIFSEPFDSCVCLDHVRSPDQHQGSALGVDLNVLRSQHRVRLLDEDLLCSQHVLGLKAAHVAVSSR